MQRAILDAADALAAATRHETYRETGAAILSRLIPGEHVLWMSSSVGGSQWRETAFYQDVCRPVGLPQQLNVMISRRTPGPTVSWTISRSDRDADFSDDDLDVARALQPLLWMAERFHARRVDQAQLPQLTDTTTDHAGAPAHPTPREAQVLALLAQGQTAAAIARRCGITPRTVRKHLENLYAKLGCSDRLLAVQRAREKGWLIS